MAKSRKNREHLSPEDFEIWSRITKSAIPLIQKDKNFSNIFGTRGQHDVSDPSRSLSDFPAGSQLQPLNNLRSSSAPVYQAVAQPKPVFPSAPIDLKTTRKISKGNIAIDGRLDLHGLNQRDAHRLLHDYVENAYYSGKRIILVITGKGNMGRGVLRENVPKWLAEPDFRRLISGFGDSHHSHGGVGALYIRIRRKS
jgi:DNA-nicking Smr family endonuclease